MSSIKNDSLLKGWDEAIHHLDIDVNGVFTKHNTLERDTSSGKPTAGFDNKSAPKSTSNGKSKIPVMVKKKESKRKGNIRNDHQYVPVCTNSLELKRSLHHLTV